MRLIRPTYSIVTFALLAPLGCSAPTEPQPELQPRLGPPEIEVLQSVACTPDRRIAFRPGQGAAPCILVPGWIESKLFPGSVALTGSFCLYEFDHANNVFDPVNDLDNIDVMVSADHSADCSAILAQEEESGPPPLSDEYDGMLRAAFRNAINRLDAFDLELPVSEPARSEVRVVVVDTIPPTEPAQPNSRHGEDMAAFVADIACPAGGGVSCAVDVRYELGLPLLPNYEEDFDDGGVLGSYGHLARAIYDAVDSVPPDTKVIINLSVGADGAAFGGPGYDEPTRVDAIEVALEYARCKGALIVAAAGNANPGCSEGPLMPASFELEPAPDAMRCNALGVPSAPPLASYQPLVYAVGGVDFDDVTPPAMDRVAMPRLAATAKHAIPETSRPPITGTSVSAAVTSGTAALLWSYFPWMSADQVMQMIYDGATPLGKNADFMGPTARDSSIVRRLDICSAFAMAQSMRSGPPTGHPPGLPPPGPPLGPPVDLPPNPLSKALTCPKPAPTSLIDLSSGLGFTEEPPTVNRTFTSTLPTECEVLCANGFEQVADNVGGPACPPPAPIHELYFGPQPPKPPCPRCVITTNDGDGVEAAQLSVYAVLHEDYEGYTVDDINVTLHEGTTPTRLRLGAVSLSTHSTTRIDLGIDPDDVDVSAAEIEISLFKAGGPGEADISEQRSNELLMDLP